MKEELQKTEEVQGLEGSPVKKRGLGVIGKLKGLWGRKKLRRWLILAVVLVVAVSAVLRGCSKNKDASAVSYTEEAASYRAITQALSGTGTLQPANSYTVTTLKEGEILSADFEEGDTVTKETVLYELDSSDVSSNLEKSQLSLNQAQRSYEKAAYAQSPVSGTVASLDVKTGDVVKAGQTVATVRDNSSMTLKVQFASDDAKSFYVGQSASVVLDGSFETLTGTVTAISGADTVLTGNRIVRSVTISVKNPGGLTDTQAATATINDSGSSENATLEYRAAEDVVASSGGTVAAINVKEGGTVSAGQAIVTFAANAANDSVQSAEDSLKSAELSMETSQKQLEDYTITSPIDGTIVDKKIKAGEKVESGNTLCIIYDLSYLEMTLSVDELDITQVTVGQNVTITADAVEGETFTGQVTKISMAGTTSNSATTYPVTVRIDDYGDLWPGMNVDAEIVLAENDNALSIPSAALERGNKVLITANSPSAANALEDKAPDNYVYVSVETGVSNDDYIEITSGLQEGDTVADLPASSSSSGMDIMIGGGPGGGEMDGEGRNGGEGGGPSGGGPGGGPTE
ncbi:efflux RND transporter periplasmic adaptor subunit [Oscillibacter sp.]|uniref:efflux RND transporter periplasmic adaptor subunit n=1 Tax=Oscillibacter sp. TaxID=1945593 RepID=UPI0028995463|nr:efflux RND transporter periplasmic adaptor subunit [Oscillibacter sp.]